MGLARHISNTMRLLVVLATLMVLTTAEWTCDDCNRLIGTMGRYLVSDESVRTQIEILLEEVCQRAGDRELCSRLVPIYWPDIAGVMWPDFYDPEWICEDMCGDPTRPPTRPTRPTDTPTRVPTRPTDTPTRVPTRPTERPTRPTDTPTRVPTRPTGVPTRPPIPSVKTITCDECEAGVRKTIEILLDDETIGSIIENLSGDALCGMVDDTEGCQNGINMLIPMGLPAIASRLIGSQVPELCNMAIP